MSVIEKTFMNFLKKLSPNKNQKASEQRLLDIGSGPGLFLKVAESRGLEAVGIEPSTEAYKYSRKKYKCKVLKKLVFFK